MTFLYIKMFYLSRYKTEKKIASFLRKRNWQLGIAESCTGGLVSSRMTDLSGSSEYIRVNFITYSNEAKSKYLGVSEKTLQNHGAVSEQTAKEMVEGLVLNTGCDVAVATTGIAGPTGGSDEKPVGTVYVGVKIKDKTVSKRFNLNPAYSRTRMKRKFTKQALEYLLEQLIIS